jgi:hypothetical protein
MAEVPLWEVSDRKALIAVAIVLVERRYCPAGRDRRDLRDQPGGGLRNVGN